VFDSGFALGDGVWEGLRLVKGRIISLQAHMDRLFEGAASIALDIGMDRKSLEQELWRTLEHNGMTDGAHIRLMVTRGTKRTPNQDPRFVIGGATIVIVAEYKAPKPEVRAQGLSLMTSTFRTSGPDVFDLRLNSHSRLNLIQALIQAINLGADEALMLDPRGFVASCNSTNFFIVRSGGEVWTSTGHYSFRGITQANVIRAWQAGGGAVHQDRCRRLAGQHGESSATPQLHVHRQAPPAVLPLCRGRQQVLSVNRYSAVLIHEARLPLPCTEHDSTAPPEFNMLTSPMGATATPETSTTGLIVARAQAPPATATFTPSSRRSSTRR
jgi:branched-subunit amino acid aminotransferase/4-amino-4-deoxychorismate lyase